jgi:RHS repeat-associated protein
MCDARSICATSKYDQLNRPWETTYSDSRQPKVTTHYDLGYSSAHATRGKVTEILTEKIVNNTGTSWEDSIPSTRLAYSFDQWGRMTGSTQELGSDIEAVHDTRNFSYKYNLSGQMTQETYPSGRVVNFGFDDARRLFNVNGGAGHVYVDAFTYTGQGLVSGYTLGNGATVSLGYGTNGRLQLSDITLAKNGTTLQKYQYSYGQIESGSVDTAKNNGQLAQVDSWIGTTQEYRQQYTYDVLNRLTRSVERYGTGLGSTAYDINYKYDPFGNRQQRAADNSGNTAIVQKMVESGDYNLVNNHYNSGVSYDASGNITADPRFRNLLYGYDANGRQNYSAQANGSSPVTVIFDGAGQKVATKASGYLSVSVYDAGGKLAAEYSQFAAPTAADIDFITPNYQGSTSVVTDNAGAVKSRHDYLPFGEELNAGVGSRTTVKMFGQPDTVRQKYAGMETDDATGLNHTLWRKDDNWSGRWTSPDPYGGSMSIADPQSFNRYAYCDNDPVNHVDLVGLSLADIGVYQTEDPSEANSDWEDQKRKQVKQNNHNTWFKSLTLQQKIAYLRNPNAGRVVGTSSGELNTTIPTMRPTAGVGESNHAHGAASGVSQNGEITSDGTEAGDQAAVGAYNAQQAGADKEYWANVTISFNKFRAKRASLTGNKLKVFDQVLGAMEGGATPGVVTGNGPLAVGGGTVGALGMGGKIILELYDALSEYRTGVLNAMAVLTYHTPDISAGISARESLRHPGYSSLNNTQVNLEAFGRMVFTADAILQSHQ